MGSPPVHLREQQPSRSLPEVGVPSAGLRKSLTGRDLRGRGGRIVFEGTPAKLITGRSTLTGKHLAAYVAG